MREKVRFVAMRAAQPDDLTRQVREARRVEVKSGVDLVPRPRTNEIQHCHHFLPYSPGREAPVWHWFMTAVSRQQGPIGARLADA